MQFYNLKTRSHVEIPDDQVEKIQMERATKTGSQIRYAMTAQHEGSKLFKFVSQEAYNDSKAKVGKMADKADDKKTTAKAADDKKPAGKKAAAPKTDDKPAAKKPAKK